MNLTTLIVTVCYVSCTVAFDSEQEEEAHYLERVQRMVDLDFGHGNIYDMPTGQFKYMTLGELKVTLVDLYTTLECSYILNMYVHLSVIKSYLLLKPKPELTADQVRMYTFAEETRRMLTAMHDVEKYGTAKYIAWTYLVYTEKIANIMWYPKIKDYNKSQLDMIAVVHKSVEKLLTRFLLDPLCRHFDFDKKLLINWPVINRDTIDYDTWTQLLIDARKTAHRQLDFNHSKSVNSADDNVYSLDALHLKGVFDQPDKLTYLLKTFYLVSDWSVVESPCQGLSVPPGNVDWNLLEINTDSFKRLKTAIQTDHHSSLVQQIRCMILSHSDFVLLMKLIPLQLINRYLVTVISTMSGDSFIEDRMATILGFNEKMADQLSAYVDCLDLRHDNDLTQTIGFFLDFSENGRLSLSEVRKFQSVLNENLEYFLETFFAGPIVEHTIFKRFKTTQADSDSAGNTNSMVQTENVTTENLHGMVNVLGEIITYIKENITNSVNFKGIHSFIDIGFSEELSRLQTLEESGKRRLS